MNFLIKLFGRGKKERNIVDDGAYQKQADEDYDRKTQALESILGKMHKMVGHSIIPFQIGGMVDMYYFPNHIPGTGFATMELLDMYGNGPTPNKLGTYELVAFTKQKYDIGSNGKTPFDLIERRVCRIFTVLGNYSKEAILSPNETCEIPADGDIESEYLIFDLYHNEKEFKIGNRKHHLLLCIRLFKSEMEYARANGGAKLIEKLKGFRHYPYSDLDREPIL